MVPLPRPDADAVADAFGLGAPLGPVEAAARGELGRVWRLATTDGTWAVKELWAPPTEAAARDDVAFQSSALEAGVSLPLPRRRPDGHVLADVPAEDGTSRIVRVYEWVDLTDRSPEPAVAGAILARLHRTWHVTDQPVHWWYREPVGERRWHELAGEASVAAVPWSGALAAAIPDLVAAEAILAEPSGSVSIRCHLDFCPDNVLLDASDRPVVIDWENSGPGSADGELAMAALDFAQPDDGAAAELVAGYAAAGGPGRLREAVTFATAIAVQGHLLEFNARRRLAADASAEDRARSDWRMTTFLARPITLERISRFLDRLNP